MIDHCLESKMYDVLVQNDQLQYNIKAGEVFDGFQEGPITFPPTYKFDKNKETYDTSDKQRIPSFTDRILYRSQEPKSIELIAYKSITELKISDHRPVFGIFNIDMTKNKIGKEASVSNV